MSETDLPENVEDWAAARPLQVSHRCLRLKCHVLVADHMEAHSFRYLSRGTSELRRSNAKPRRASKPPECWSTEFRYRQPMEREYL